jgi:hypothetical protein
MYAAFYSKIKNGIKKIKSSYNEWYTVSGSLLALVVFSMSRFQLPYYANIIFTLLAILCANFIWQQNAIRKKTFATVQLIITIIVLALGTGLFIFYKPEVNLFVTILLLLVIIVYAFSGGKLSMPVNYLFHSCNPVLLY